MQVGKGTGVLFKKGKIVRKVRERDFATGITEGNPGDEQRVNISTKSQALSSNGLNSKSQN